jgi:hypothetical protein
MAAGVSTLALAALLLAAVIGMSALTPRSSHHGAPVSPRPPLPTVGEGLSHGRERGSGGEGIPVAGGEGVQAPAGAGVLWRADHERGDLSEWSAGDCGGDFSNGSGSAEHTDASVHGDGGLRLWVPDTRTRESVGARMFRWCEAQKHRALYYSAWYYFPFQVQVDGWWWIMEWKSEGSFNGKFGLAVRNRGDGEMSLVLVRGEDSGGGTWEQRQLTLPVHQWVHLEAYYQKASNQRGRVTVWQDGEQILDVTGVQTANGNDLRWAVVNYGQDTDPSDVDIFVDDAAISTRRLGP